MSIPLKKILLWVALLLLVMLLYSMWKLRSTERQLETFVKTELAPTDTTYGVKLRDVNVRVRNGLLELHDIEYYAATDSLVWRADRLTLGIGTWKSLQMGLLPAAYVLATVNQTEMDVRGLKIGDYTSFDAALKLFGRPFDLFPIIAEQRFPARAMRLEAKADALPEGILQPLLEQAGYSQLNTGIREIVLTASVDPSTARAALNQVRLSGPGSPELTGSATFFYDTADAAFNREQVLLSGARFEGGIRIILPEEGAFSVIPVGSTGSLGFRETNWQFTGDLDSTRSSPLHIQHHRFSMTNPVLYPQPGALGQLGNALVLFGVPTQSLPFTQFEAEIISPYVDIYTIRNVVLQHVNFRASFDGNFGGSSIDRLLETPIQGSIRLDSMSDEVRQAVLSMEMLLGWQLQRDGDAILLPVDFRNGFQGALP